MPDYIGPIEVPEQAPSGVFPIAPDYPFGRAIAPRVITHSFQSANAKIEQRFLQHAGNLRFVIRKGRMTEAERAALEQFFIDRKGPYQPFTFNAPNETGSGTTAYTVRFAEALLSVEQLSDQISAGELVLVEAPQSTPSHSITETLSRFPSTTAKAALLAQVQQCIPLVKIRAADVGVADIYLSDRRVTIGANTYLPRLLSWSGIRQSIGAETETPQFTFGNADKVMRDLVAAVDLENARIEFSLFIVSTGTLLNLWAGYVQTYGGDENEQFTIRASDVISKLSIIYPTRTISRQCWKRYKDGINCTAASGLTSCNKSWDDCVARSNTNQFGGHVVPPNQLVRLKDNSTGFAGFGRKSITANSVIGDSPYDQPLPRVFTDRNYPVPAKILAVRDESEFFTALGVVCQGPIGAFAASGHLLDGQPHHGPGNLGLRYSLGSSPSNPDLFALDETSGGEPQHRSAGTAFMQIRRSDEKGFQPSLADSHEMTAVVSAGESGWVWSGPGARSSTVLTNPVWVAVNIFLEALGLKDASAATQESYFDVAAAVTAANYCDQVISKIIGVGTAKQFTFRGKLDQEKSLRDDLQEVLNNCLGFFTFRNGKLVIGIRAHSGSLSGGAYTAGNIVFGTLSTARVVPAFNKLKIAFAHEDYEWGAWSVELGDEDHAMRAGDGRPRYSTQTMNLVGTSTPDQAARICTVRLREELGGLSAAEQRAARVIRFRTTVLGLETEVGAVISVTHEDIPGGAGEFRVTGWELMPDFSIEMEARSTTDSMYDLVAGPKPGDADPEPLPTEPIAMPLIGCWHPNYEVPIAGDPLFDVTRRRFTVRQSYETMADGVSVCRLSVEGYLPVNRFVTSARPSLRQVAGDPSGGSLEGDTDYYLQVACYDSAGRFSPPSVPVRVSIPSGTNAGRISVGSVDWPTGTWSGYKVYLSDSPHLLTLQSTNAGALPSGFVVGVHANTSNEGVPVAVPSPRIRAKVKRIVHSGIIGTNIAAVGTGYFQLGPGIITADDEFNGRLVSVIADNDGEADLWNFLITDTVLATNRLVVSGDPSAFGIGTNDTLVIRTKATSSSATQLGDTKWVNALHPGGNTNDETGKVIRIISGTGAGQVRRVASNTTTVHTVDRPFDPAPDATSVWIVEEAAWLHQAESTAVETDIANALVKLQVDVSNYQEQSLLVLATLVTDNAESFEDLSPWREIWVYGQDALDSSTPTLDPITNLVLTSPVPSGWASNPDYWAPAWPPQSWVYVGITYTPPASGLTAADIWRKKSGDADEKAILCGTYNYGGVGNGKAEISMEQPDSDATWLFTAAARSANVVNKPDFSDSSATEAVFIAGRNSLTAAITGASVVKVDYTDEAGQFWGPRLDMSLPLTNDTWSWCDWTMQHLGVDPAERLVAGFPRSTTNPVVKIEKGWGLPTEDQVAAGQNVYRFRLYLFRNDGVKVLQTNPWGNGTSNLDLTVTRPVGGAGQENAPVVTINSPNTYLEYSTSQDGVSMMRARVAITLPASKGKYLGFRIVLAPAATVADTNTWIELGETGSNTQNYIGDWMPTPPAGSYKLLLLSMDLRKRYNSYAAGVTPFKDVTIDAQPANLLLSRTKGKLTYEGVTSPFEGVEVKSQNGPFSTKLVAWMGSGTETGSTLDLAITGGNISCRVANISPYVTLVGQFIRVVHASNPSIWERAKIQSINTSTRVITIAYNSAGNAFFANNYPFGSQVLIDYVGGWLEQLRVGQTIQDAPLYVDDQGNIVIRSVGGKYPTILIERSNIRTAISNQPNTEAPSTDIDGIAVSPIADPNNVACLSLSGTSGVRTPYLKLATAFLKSLFVRYNNTTGGEVVSTDFTTSVQDFLLTGNRNNAYGISGSPGNGQRGLLAIANIILNWKLFHGSKELVRSSGAINLEHGQLRFFDSSWTDAAVKAALNPGEIATRYNQLGQNVFVGKHNDGSGNAFEWNNTRTL